jgi:hypothetical protein
MDAELGTPDPAPWREDRNLVVYHAVHVHNHFIASIRNCHLCRGIPRGGAYGWVMGDVRTHRRFLKISSPSAIHIGPSGSVATPSCHHTFHGALRSEPCMAVYLIAISNLPSSCKHAKWRDCHFQHQRQALRRRKCSCHTGP